MPARFAGPNRPAGSNAAFATRTYLPDGTLADVLPRDEALRALVRTVGYFDLGAFGILRDDAYGGVVIQFFGDETFAHLSEHRHRPALLLEVLDFLEGGFVLVQSDRMFTRIGDQSMAASRR